MCLGPPRLALDLNPPMHPLLPRLFQASACLSIDATDR